MTTASVADGDPDYANRLINEQEAANFLGFSVRALQNWRLRGGGPEYVRVSRRSVPYRRRDLIAWSEERLEAHTSAATGKTLEPPSEQPQRQAASEGGAHLRRDKATTSEADPPEEEEENPFGRYALIRR